MRSTSWLFWDDQKIFSFMATIWNIFAARGRFRIDFPDVVPVRSLFPFWIRFCFRSCPSSKWNSRMLYLGKTISLDSVMKSFIYLACLSSSSSSCFHYFLSSSSFPENDFWFPSFAGMRSCQLQSFHFRNKIRKTSGYGDMA